MPLVRVPHVISLSILPPVPPRHGGLPRPPRPASAAPGGGVAWWPASRELLELLCSDEAQRWWRSRSAPSRCEAEQASSRGGVHARPPRGAHAWPPRCRGGTARGRPRRDGAAAATSSSDLEVAPRRSSAGAKVPAAAASPPSSSLAGSRRRRALLPLSLAPPVPCSLRRLPLPEASLERQGASSLPHCRPPCHASARCPRRPRRPPHARPRRAQQAQQDGGLHARSSGGGGEHEPCHGRRRRWACTSPPVRAASA